MSKINKLLSPDSSYKDGISWKNEVAKVVDLLINGETGSQKLAIDEKTRRKLEKKLNRNERNNNLKDGDSNALVWLLREVFAQEKNIIANLDKDQYENLHRMFDAVLSVNALIEYKKLIQENTREDLGNLRDEIGEWDELSGRDKRQFRRKRRAQNKADRTWGGDVVMASDTMRMSGRRMKQELKQDEELDYENIKQKKIKQRIDTITRRWKQDKVNLWSFFDVLWEHEDADGKIADELFGKGWSDATIGWVSKYRDAIRADNDFNYFGTWKKLNNAERNRLKKLTVWFYNLDDKFVCEKDDQDRVLRMFEMMNNTTDTKVVDTKDQRNHGFGIYELETSGDLDYNASWSVSETTTRLWMILGDKNYDKRLSAPWTVYEQQIGNLIQRAVTSLPFTLNLELDGPQALDQVATNIWAMLNSRADAWLLMDINLHSATKLDSVSIETVEELYEFFKEYPQGVQMLRQLFFTHGEEMANRMIYGDQYDEHVQTVKWVDLLAQDEDKEYIDAVVEAQMPAKWAEFESTLTDRTAEIQAELVAARDAVAIASDTRASKEAQLRLDHGLQHLSAIESTATAMRSPVMQSKRQKSFSLAVSDVVGYRGAWAGMARNRKVDTFVDSVSMGVWAFSWVWKESQAKQNLWVFLWTTKDLVWDQESRFLIAASAAVWAWFNADILAPRHITHGIGLSGALTTRYRLNKGKMDMDTTTRNFLNLTGTINSTGWYGAMLSWSKDELVWLEQQKAVLKANAASVISNLRDSDLTPPIRERDVRWYLVSILQKDNGKMTVRDETIDAASQYLTNVIIDNVDKAGNISMSDKQICILSRNIAQNWYNTNMENVSKFDLTSIGVWVQILAWGAIALPTASLGLTARSRTRYLPSIESQNRIISDMEDGRNLDIKERTTDQHDIDMINNKAKLKDTPWEILFEPAVDGIWPFIKLPAAALHQLSGFVDDETVRKYGVIERDPRCGNYLVFNLSSIPVVGREIWEQEHDGDGPSRTETKIFLKIGWVDTHTRSWDPKTTSERLTTDMITEEGYFPHFDSMFGDDAMYILAGNQWGTEWLVVSSTVDTVRYLTALTKSIDPDMIGMMDTPPLTLLDDGRLQMNLKNASPAIITGVDLPIVLASGTGLVLTKTISPKWMLTYVASVQNIGLAWFAFDIIEAPTTVTIQDVIVDMCSDQISVNSGLETYLDTEQSSLDIIRIGQSKQEEFYRLIEEQQRDAAKKYLTGQSAALWAQVQDATLQWDLMRIYGAFSRVWITRDKNLDQAKLLSEAETLMNALWVPATAKSDIMAVINTPSLFSTATSTSYYKYFQGKAWFRGWGDGSYSKMWKYSSSLSRLYWMMTPVSQVAKIRESSYRRRLDQESHYMTNPSLRDGLMGYRAQAIKGVQNLISVPGDSKETSKHIWSIGMIAWYEDSDIREKFVSHTESVTESSVAIDGPDRRAHLQYFLDNLRSSSPMHRDALQLAVKWLAEALPAAGIDVTTIMSSAEHFISLILDKKLPNGALVAGLNNVDVNFYFELYPHCINEMMRLDQVCFKTQVETPWVPDQPDLTPIIPPVVQVPQWQGSFAFGNADVLNTADVNETPIWFSAIAWWPDKKRTVESTTIPLTDEELDELWVWFSEGELTLIDDPEFINGWTHVLVDGVPYEVRELANWWKWYNTPDWWFHVLNDQGQWIPVAIYRHYFDNQDPNALSIRLVDGIYGYTDSNNDFIQVATVSQVESIVATGEYADGRQVAGAALNIYNTLHSTANVIKNGSVEYLDRSDYVSV